MESLKSLTQAKRRFDMNNSSDLKVECGCLKGDAGAAAEPKIGCCAEHQLDSGNSPSCGPESVTQAKGKPLDIEFMYLDLSVCTRCQGTETRLEEAILEVTRVLEATGLEVAVRKVHIQSEEQAAAMGFAVSPTIRVNGRDIQMDWRESLCDTCGELSGCAGGVTCREWEYRGQWYTVPPKGLIVDAILQNVYGREDQTSQPPTLERRVPDNLKRFFRGRPTGAD
jgi:hypothetical protein